MSSSLEEARLREQERAVRPSKRANAKSPIASMETFGGFTEPGFRG